MSIDRISVLKAYFGTRRAHARLRTRTDIEKRQAALWRTLASTIADTPALKHKAGEKLEHFPIVSTSEIRERFDQWNTLGLMSASAHQAAASAERGGSGEVAPGLSAGFSTGTSGSRGVFLASRAERARYLGQALAKLLPGDALFRRRRIGLCLRADSALYRDVGNAGPFTFRFFELAMQAEPRAQHIAAFAPHILIAPSHVLADLGSRVAAGMSALPNLERVYYGAEPMGEAERKWLADVLGVRPDPIYQATEGFLGAPCRYGVLHLNEDSLVIERTPVSGTTRFRPVVTDLRRTSQPIVRVQLDDLLEPLDAPCLCGSPLLAVHGVEGRAADLWRWDNVVIMPREVDEAVTAAIGAQANWRVTGAANVVRLETLAIDAAAATNAIADLMRERGVSRPVETVPLMMMEGFKRRRVRWSDG